ncbi:hypothetical protein P154DRAFT_577820 [Amniculicola lignicola CBS 123094]|uniref:Uncharacterized protein n=1 Tax=Amniculicola lignicola CBS 123094 TaxID=1392246 RepID=A0A6A5WH17_9PLEO|nr:hypothetical protein P154DRAFT_577820 [Amniculicola lignicola CBS 123094]
MTTPCDRRLSGGPSANSGPNRSVLHKLLQEISGFDPTVATPNQILTPKNSPTSRGRPRADSVTQPSVWVAGGTIAQDARDKLRAADEARLRKYGAHQLSPDPLEPEQTAQIRRRSTQLTDIRTDVPDTNTRKQPPRLTRIQTKLLNTEPPPYSSEASPHSGRSESTSDKRLNHSPPHSPVPLAKRARTMSQTSRDFWNAIPPPTPSETDISPTITDESTETIPSLLSKRPTFTERHSPGTGDEPSVSSFRPERTLPQGNIPSTPVRRARTSLAYPRSASVSPYASTPAWMKPMHLFDGEEKSIYYNRHGSN